MPDERATRKPGVTRREMIQRTAVVSTALWVPPLIESIRLPAHAQVASPAPCVVDGFMTGGGFVFISGNTGPTARYNLLKLDCPPLDSPPELKVTWKVGSIKYEFNLTSFTSRICLDTAVPNGANANFDTAEGTGTGTLQIGNTTQAGTVEFRFIDGGEPSQTADDTVTIIIRDASNNIVLNVVNQLVDGGNLQAHDGNYAFGNACTQGL